MLCSLGCARLLSCLLYIFCHLSTLIACTTWILYAGKQADAPEREPLDEASNDVASDEW